MDRTAPQVLAELVDAHSQRDEARFAGLQRELVGQLATLEGVASEYNAWISASSSTSDFDAWLAKRLAGQTSPT